MKHLMCTLQQSWDEIRPLLLLHNLHVAYRFPPAHSVDLRTAIRARTQLLSMVVDAIDTLLEDWYPMLGTRFVHTSEGRLLVTRLVPCDQCIRTHMALAKTDFVEHENDWTLVAMDSQATRDAMKTRSRTEETLKTMVKCEE